MGNTMSSIKGSKKTTAVLSFTLLTHLPITIIQEMNRPEETAGKAVLRETAVRVAAAFNGRKNTGFPLKGAGVLFD